MTIFLDMDEVLVDFIEGACKAHNKDVVEEKQRLANTELWNLADFWGLSLEAFWRPIDQQGESFWTELNAQPWNKGLLSIINHKLENWYIVTAPSRSPYSYSGKIKWLQEYFRNEDIHNVIITRHKHLLANPESILIDDNQMNILGFTNYGGTGILFPGCGNSNSKYLWNPLVYLAKELSCLDWYMENKDAHSI